MPHGLHILPSMNSLNIITARVSPASTPAPSRSNSVSSLSLAVTAAEEHGNKALDGISGHDNDNTRAEPRGALQDDHGIPGVSENTPLLGNKEIGVRVGSWHSIPKRIATTILNSLRWVLSTLVSPGVYLIACFYDENGKFAPLLQLKKLFGIHDGSARKLTNNYLFEEKDGQSSPEMTSSAGYGGVSATRHPVSSNSSSSGLSSDSESDADRAGQGSGRSSSSRHARSKTSQDSEEIAPGRRSIRIKLNNDDAMRQRKHKKGQSANPRAQNGGDVNIADISAQLKSPTSPVGALTKYPKTPAPPRPLIPRRQPSYVNLEPLAPQPQKTLILDLDETLIHSMSKGGRMSTGHMVEVRLNTTIVAAGGQTSIGPQHPILYYVHKRPHCDDFLRRVRVARLQ